MQPGEPSSPSPAARSARAAAWLTAAGLLAALAAVAAVAWYAWASIGPTQMGLHGFLALGLGAAATLLLGAGLMTLVVLSSRRGYDDEVGRD